MTIEAECIANRHCASDALGFLRGRDIVCISMDWNGDPLSRTHLMRLLSRENRILWMNSFGSRTPSISKADLTRAWRKLVAYATPVTEVERNIFVLNPLAVPSYSNPLIRRLNRGWLRWQVRGALRRLGMSDPILWITDPAAAILAGQLNEQLIVYHCVDETTAFRGVPSDTIGRLEEVLLKRADFVFVTSQHLYDTKRRLNPHIALVQHGVDHEHFRRALESDTPVPAEIEKLPKPVIGFFGLVADWVDVELMAEVARHFSTGSLVIVGRVDTDVSILEAMPNVHLLGRQPYGDLPAYSKGFDVAIVPFRVNELTRNCNPLKVREYLAAGLPVVSTPIPEVERLTMCRVADGTTRFLHEIEAALHQPGPLLQRSEMMRSESWEARLQEMDRHLSEAIARKKDG